MLYSFIEVKSVFTLKGPNSGSRVKKFGATDNGRTQGQIIKNGFYKHFENDKLKTSGKKTFQIKNDRSFRI